MAIIRHAQVWMPADVESKDMKAGPQDGKGFAPEETVTCEYELKKVKSTPKFWCEIDAGPPQDSVKVKYNSKNGEVYGEVAATRLLWALGFGADRMYPVKVLCRGCPPDFEPPGSTLANAIVFDVAAIERKMSGYDVAT